MSPHAAFRDLPVAAHLVLQGHLRAFRQHLGGPVRHRQAALREIAADLADATEAYLAAGWPPDVAAQHAIRDFGHPHQTAKALTDVLIAAGQDAKTRTTLALTSLALLLWGSIFVAGPAEPWRETLEPAGTDMSTTTAATTLAAAGSLTIAGVALAWLRRRGLAPPPALRHERTLTCVARGLVGSCLVSLAFYLALRLDVAPSSVPTFGFAAAGVVGLGAVGATCWRNRVTVR